MSRGQDGHAGTEGVVEPMLEAEPEDYYAALNRLRDAWNRCKPDDWAADDSYFHLGDWTMLHALIEQRPNCNVVIAPAQDVITADQRARLRHLIRYFDGYKAPEQIGIAAWEIRDTLVTLAEGGHDGQ